MQPGRIQDIATATAPVATASSSHLDGTGKELTIEQGNILWDAGDLLSPAARTTAVPFTLQHLSSASMKGKEQVQSEDYLRSHSEVSHYVLVQQGT